jgi:tetratricopeptide (TPR) repeat protein
MSPRLSAIFCALTLALSAATVQAAPNKSPYQSPTQSPLDKPGKKDLVEPPANPPKPPRGDRVRNLDFLFGALKAAPDDASAKHIEDRIWALWLVSGSDTCNLLMTRVKTAVDAENYDLAIRLLDAIIELKPKYVEAWNRRATVFFLKKDYGSAIADLRQVLTREPRHFGALSGLGAMLQDIGDEKDALEAYRRALAVHPHLNGIADKVKALTEKVEGRDI